MLTTSAEKSLSTVIAIGSGVTTILVVSDSVTDPVNTPKLLSLGVAACIACGILAVSLTRNLFRSTKVVLTLIVLFLSSGFISVFLSDSPISQGIYGSYGRNNGILAYVFLGAMLLVTSTLQKIKSIDTVIRGLLLAGVVNVVYCLWVISFGDFIGWSNPYGNILGTLGNPNFIGSFLGIFISAYLAYAVGGKSSKWFKYSCLVVLPLTLFEILESNAIQGRIVALAGFAIVGFFLVRSKLKIVYIWIYSVGIVFVGLLGALGALQIGPLTAVVYKASVSLRGQYWLAGWNTGQRQPLNGVGMDSFGDWYRRSRDIQALETPGVNIVVNAAHNVPIDMFAFGGWPLFLTYVSIMCLGAVALLKMILRTKVYDPILVVLVSAWVGYQLQSLISINQIGLAVWGWVLTGLAISYERISRGGVQSNDKQVESRETPRKVVVNQQAHPKLMLSSTIFGLIGLLIALPPFSADTKWRSAQVAQSVVALEQSMIPSYFNPQNTSKYVVNIQTLEQSNFQELAHKYALQAVEWNPNSFELWKLLYLIRASSPEEKMMALNKMKRLDPLNPDVLSLK